MDDELNIGDAVVICGDHDAQRADAADRRAARRFPPSCGEVPGEVDAFCAALSGLPSFYVLARALVPPLPLPRGFRHFRLFTPGADEPFHRTLIVERNAREITSHTVLHGVLAWPCMEVTAWSTTTRRATAIPGVLDLEMDVVARETFRPLRLRE